MKNLQQAADDVGTIAETVQALGKLLDRFYRTHGNALYSRIESVWPDAANFSGDVGSKLYKLEQELTPPDIR